MTVSVASSSSFVRRSATSAASFRYGIFLSAIALEYQTVLLSAVIRGASYRSPLLVVRENVISCLHDRVAPEPALGVVPLRRLVGRGGGRERIGRSVVVERGPSPSAAVREPLAVLHHEVDVMQACRHHRRGERFQLF